MPAKGRDQDAPALQPAITYYRYSSHRQGEQSIEGQRDAAERWARQNGYTIVKEYADREQTGRNDDREQFQLMLRELDRLHPDALILWKVDRMGRNKEEIAFNKYRCKRAGVKVVYTAENIPSTPEGVILESVLEGMAEYFSLQLSQNVRRGMRMSATKCQSTGGTHPLGYRLGADKCFEIDPNAAAIVRQVFERYVAGESQPEIVDALNAQGLRTAVGRPFNHNSLRKILQNEKYIGVYTYNNGEVRVEGGIPAIIEPALFYKAQRIMESNRRAPSHFHKNRADYILTDKLFCGRCGDKMIGACGRGKMGVKYYYYSCSRRHGDKKKYGPRCTKKNVRKDWIEPLVLRETKALLYDDALIDFIVENTYAYYVESNADTAYTEALQAQLKEVETSLGNLLKAIEAGIFNDLTRKRMDELSAQQQQLVDSIKAGGMRGQPLTHDHIRYFLLRFREMNIDDRACQKQLIDTFINAVFVYDDKITITYNYSGDGRTITLAEIDHGEKFASSGRRRTIARTDELFIVHHVFARSVKIEDC